MKTKAKKAGHIGTILIWQSPDGYWCIGNTRMKHCPRSMFRRWGVDVPSQVKKVWFSLYSRTVVNRVELSVRMARQFGIDYCQLEDGSRPIAENFPGTRDYVGKPVYLEVEYLEP